MALVRAFTSKRTKRAEISHLGPARSASIINKNVSRAQISAPMELLSTTNMLSFNAPDLPSTSHSNHLSSSSSSSSIEESDNSPVDYSTSATSVDSRSTSPEPNHLSCYFNGPSRSNSTTTGNTSRQSPRTSTDPNAPVVPQRALSHTTATHKAMARSRSTRQSPPPNAIHTLPCPSSSATTRTSADMFSAAPITSTSTTTTPSSHPFGRELEQVNELAEEYGVVNSVLIEEEQILRSRGLRKFGVDDYLREIEGLLEGGGVFEDRLIGMGPGWI
ncbi:MAG: hypothetical protein M1817_005044 [Caeruleum heppii]|nr:MAG: hypothetical protein M1817_005044 [Caeruleum heppii]